MKKRVKHIGKKETIKLTVSVILPVLFSSRTSRRNKTLTTALDSISNQTVLPTEVIVVTSGELSNMRYVKWPSNLEIKVIEEQGGSNPAKARNIGIQSAQGELIAFLDSDDVWAAEYLEIMLNLFLDRSIEAASAMAFSTKDGLMFARTSRILEDNQTKALIHRNFIQAISAFMIRKSTFTLQGGFNEDLTLAEDLEFYVRLSQHVKIHSISLFLVERRVGKDSLTNNYTDRFRDIINAHEAITGELMHISKPEIISFLAFLRIWRIINKISYFSILWIKTFVSMLLCILRFKGKISILKGAFQYVKSSEERNKPRNNQLPRQKYKDSSVVILNMSVFNHAELINNSFLKRLGIILQSKYNNIKLIPLNSSRVWDDRVPLSVIATALEPKLQVIHPPLAIYQIEDVVKAAKLVVTNYVLVTKIAVKFDIKTLFITDQYKNINKMALPKGIRILDIDSLSSDDECMQRLTKYFDKL